MARFTDRQLELLQAYVDKTVAAFESAGLSFSVESDLAAWADTMRNAPSITAVSPSFDPEHSWLTPANSFWVRLRDREGKVIGCICSRLFETDDCQTAFKADPVSACNIDPLKCSLPSWVMRSRRR
ncbi:hypothetical protein ABIE65_000001, partial [Constrictibacter sp. MBR-5]|uniref:hypothetical protein n=1 Tax=Constrictibacter sp. MBR-5 TaxID=3156467 RepID=UPI0033953D40